LAARIDGNGNLRNPTFSTLRAEIHDAHHIIYPVTPAPIARALQSAATTRLSGVDHLTKTQRDAKDFFGDPTITSTRMADLFGVPAMDHSVSMPATVRVLIADTIEL
jgi:hypothetical protein